jgi:predicted pyridoxine 5'-phosphate oxidase superfamily flavin-nucleotide-binding protein
MPTGITRLDQQASGAARSGRLHGEIAQRRTTKMTNRYHEIAFTDAVKAQQNIAGSRSSYARFEDPGGVRNAKLGPPEAAFMAARDSFYMASVSQSGWPYVQHRGGSPGFVHTIDAHTIGFADFRGNRQYVSMGNLAGDDRVSLFFMDYAIRARLKLYGRAKAVTQEEWAQLVPDAPAPKGVVERGVVIQVEAFDWNCPQHITERFTLADVNKVTAALQAKITELEEELGRLKHK